MTLVVGLSTVPLLAASKPPVRARNGMVVSANRIASEVGVQILKSGGNAVDAAIATGFALAVVHPAAGNIGGGGFMIVRLADGTTSAFDFREKAPLAAHERMFVDSNGQLARGLNHDGYLAVGVPGTVAGFALAHKRYGKLPWARLLQPAIKLAEKGFPLSHKLASDFRALAPAFKKYPASARKFLKPDGSFYEEGEIWRQPDLAATLKRIARRGADGFYKGKTAELIEKQMKANGGLITREDLASYEAKERQPIEVDYRGYRVISMPPPSSGGVTLGIMLNILEGYELEPLGHNSAAYLHLLAEAMRRAYRDRARYLGDPDFNPDMPVERLLSKEYAAELRQTINPWLASKSSPADVQEPTESTETTHYSVVDAAGNAVSTTYTLERWYGSKIVVEGAGFLLNNEMGDFNPVPGLTDTTGLIGTRPNLVAPGKRMLSSMTPTLVVRGDSTFMVIGSPGGRTIINTVLQSILNVVDFGMNISEAIDAPRIHHQWLPDVLRIEKYGTTVDTIRLLQGMGHRVRVTRSMNSQGRAMGIIIDPESGMRLGAADPRSPDGAAVGY
jgi:gamma-glutamyltranspeptidase/glutathione hydrolase